MTPNTKLVRLSVKKRDFAGKGKSRALRREGFVPGVIYGAKQAPAMFAVIEKDLVKEMGLKGFRTRQFEIDIEGDKHRAICQSIELHPVTDRPLHIDFLRVAKDSKLHIEIPVIFVNEAASPGLKLGGVLNVIMRSVPVICSPDDIPEKIEIDLTGLEMNDSVSITDIKLPEGVVMQETGETAIVSITAPTTVKEEEPKEAESAEGAAAETAAAKTGAGAAPAAATAKPAAADKGSKK